MRVLGAVVVFTLVGVAGCAPSSKGEGVEQLGGAVTASSADAGAVVRLGYTPQFILGKVLEKKRLTFDAQKPIPELRFASQVTLEEFQDAIEPQWGMRPPAITNAYVVARNVIYLMDDGAYYTQHQRYIDDSLAHELTHYVQVKYQGWVLDGADDSIEADAIDVQTWFRQSFCPPPPSPSP